MSEEFKESRRERLFTVYQIGGKEWTLAKPVPGDVRCDKEGKPILQPNGEVIPLSRIFDMFQCPDGDVIAFVVPLEGNRFFVPDSEPQITKKTALQYRIKALTIDHSLSMSDVSHSWAMCRAMSERDAEEEEILDVRERWANEEEDFGEPEPEAQPTSETAETPRPAPPQGGTFYPGVQRQAPPGTDSSSAVVE